MEVDALVVSSAQGEKLYTLKDADRPYRHLVEQLSEGAFTLSAKGVVLFANSYLADLLGAPLEHVMGQPFSNWVREKDRPRFAKLLHQGLKASAKGELELVSTTLEPRPVQLSLRLLQTEEEPRITVVLFDLGERRRSEQALRRLNEELELRVAERTAELQEANESLLERGQALEDANQALEAVNEELRSANEELVKANLRSENEIFERKQTEVRLQAAYKELDSFSYSVSHDLRTPLSSIASFAAMILQDYGAQLPPEVTNLGQLIRQNAQEMGRLIEALLSLSRTSRQLLARQTVAPKDLVTDVLRTHQPLYENRHVQLIVQDMPSCQADPVLLRQVYANLLSNALKFTRTCSAARIEIGHLVDESETVYFVKDNGVGFDMAHADKLFGVFQRLHGEEEYEGSGIGLAIVQRIIHRHGGRVWATGKVGEGATFYFTLADRISGSTGV